MKNKGTAIIELVLIVAIFVGIAASTKLALDVQDLRSNAMIINDGGGGGVINPNSPVIRGKNCGLCGGTICIKCGAYDNNVEQCRSNTDCGGINPPLNSKDPPPANNPRPVPTLAPLCSNFHSCRYDWNNGDAPSTDRMMDYECCDGQYYKFFYRNYCFNPKDNSQTCSFERNDNLINQRSGHDPDKCPSATGNNPLPNCDGSTNQQVKLYINPSDIPPEGWGKVQSGGPALIDFFNKTVLNNNQESKNPTPIPQITVANISITER